jgi:SAM-dependent methyltransferase
VSTADRERWDARYAEGDAGEPVPPAALAGRETLLPAAGPALDVACGRGAVAVWLAQRGLAVDAVDVSPVGLAAGRARPGGDAVRWIEADLDDGLPVAGPYDVVVSPRFRAPALYGALVDALAPGGLLVVTVLAGGDGPHRAAPGELIAAFGHLAVVHHEETGSEAHLVARRP